jgi:hypothetical protein
MKDTLPPEPPGTIAVSRDRPPTTPPTAQNRAYRPSRSIGGSSGFKDDVPEWLLRANQLFPGVQSNHGWYQALLDSGGLSMKAVISKILTLAAKVWKHLGVSQDEASKALLVGNPDHDTRCSNACTRAGLTGLILSTIAFAMLPALDKSRELDALIQYVSMRLSLEEDVKRLEGDAAWKILTTSPTGKLATSS